MRKQLGGWWRIEARLHSFAPRFSWWSVGLLTSIFVVGVFAANVRAHQATMCLGENLYHEGRGESLENQRKMGMIMLARITDPDKQWPKTICGSAAQDNAYSWVLDYRLATNRNEQKAWERSQALAQDLIENAWNKYKLPARWECVRYYKVTNWKSTYFDKKLRAVDQFGKHTAYAEKKRCRVALPTS